MRHEIHLHIYQPPADPPRLAEAGPQPAAGGDAAWDNLIGDIVTPAQIDGFSLGYTPPADGELLKGVVAAVADSKGLPPGAEDSPLLKRINETIARLKARGAKAGEIGAAIRRIIHSPATALLVALTPNKIDDTVLEMLKGMFPLE